MSTITTSSASPFWTTRMAVVAPTNPLPTIVTRMPALPFQACGENATAYWVGRRRTWLGADLQPRLLQHQHEVVGLRGGPKGVVHGDQSLPHHAQQGLIEGLHPVVVAVGDDLVDLGGSVRVQDPVGDAAVVDHDLDGGDPAAAGPGNQPHADDSAEHAGQRDAHLVLLVRREEVDDPGHG